MKNGESDPIWERHIALLLRTDGIAALAERDELAQRDTERLVRSLGSIVSSGTVEPGLRIRAVWLLKDLMSAVVVPDLLSAFSAPFATGELQSEILDTLERAAFAGNLPALDLAKLEQNLRRSDENRKFMNFLATVATDQAREMLGRYALEPECRTQLVDDLSSRPEGWIGDFLDHLLLTVGPDAQLLEAIDARRRQERLRHLSNTSLGDLTLVRSLWADHKFSLLLRLANEDKLAPEALTFIMSAENPAPLSKGQRQLLAKVKAVAAAKLSG